MCNVRGNLRSLVHFPWGLAPTHPQRRPGPPFGLAALRLTAFASGSHSIAVLAGGSASAPDSHTRGSFERGRGVVPTAPQRPPRCSQARCCRRSAQACCRHHVHSLRFVVAHACARTGAAACLALGCAQRKPPLAKLGWGVLRCARHPRRQAGRAPSHGDFPSGSTVGHWRTDSKITVSQCGR